MNCDLDSIFKLAKQTALRAGEYALHALETHDFEINQKKDLSLVTTVDTAVEKMIVDSILSNFADHSILAEESFSKTSDQESLLGPLWVIDPIDGTTNFSRGLPIFAVSIAFAMQGEVKIGVVHCPMLKKTYTAIKGQGAFSNEIPIEVSSNQHLEHALIATGFPQKRQHLANLIARAEIVLKHCADLRRFGAASVDICMVADGKIDGYYENVNPWDIAAASLIAREAGATVGQYHKAPEQEYLPQDLRSQKLLVASPKLFPSLKEILSSYCEDLS